MYDSILLFIFLLAGGLYLTYIFQFLQKMCPNDRAIIGFARDQLLGSEISIHSSIPDGLPPFTFILGVDFPGSVVQVNTQDRLNPSTVEYTIDWYFWLSGMIERKTSVLYPVKLSGEDLLNPITHIGERWNTGGWSLQLIQYVFFPQVVMRISYMDNMISSVSPVQILQPILSINFNGQYRF